jgi:hypothetical protein
LPTRELAPSGSRHRARVRELARLELNPWRFRMDILNACLKPAG